MPPRRASATPSSPRLVGLAAGLVAHDDTPCFLAHRPGNLAAELFDSGGACSRVMASSVPVKTYVLP
jgi:hypothetical protein